MIFIGYLAIFAYIFFLIFGVGTLTKKVFNVETSRKVIHTGLFLVWILIDIFMKGTIHQVIIPVIFTIINFLSYKFKIFKNIEREAEKQPGTVYFAIAITIIMLIGLIFPETYYCSGIATFCLTFGDGFAALIGRNTKSKLIRNNKSLNGFISCFVISTLATFCFNYFYNLELNIIMCTIIGLAVAIFELVDKGLDNFSVVFISFAISLLFLNYNLPNIAECILLAEILFVIIFLAKGLDYYGSLLAMVMCVSYMYFGGIFGITILLSEYFFIFFVAVFKKLFMQSAKKEKARTFLQVLINGGLGTIFVILYGIFKIKKLLIISIISLSGCFIDSVSSDVGTLSKKAPYDFLKRKRVQKGISGGVSLLGTFSSIICSFLISFATYKVLNLNVLYLILIASLIFLQTVIDSIIGSSLQAKYKCNKCKKVTEKNVHCDRKAKLISGFNWIDNNMVNAMSSIITTTIAAIILWRL